MAFRIQSKSPWFELTARRSHGVTSGGYTGEIKTDPHIVSDRSHLICELFIYCEQNSSNFDLIRLLISPWNTYILTVKWSFPKRCEPDFMLLTAPMIPESHLSDDWTMSRSRSLRPWWSRSDHSKKTQKVLVYYWNSMMKQRLAWGLWYRFFTRNNDRTMRPVFINYTSMYTLSRYITSPCGKTKKALQILFEISFR